MANEVGMLLKKQLGLNIFLKVYYARLIGISAYKIYYVFFDSRRPGTNLTSVECHRQTFATSVNFLAGKRLSLTNILPIEDFGGTLAGALFVRIDLSGRFQQFYRMSESVGQKGFLFEDMSLSDFKTAAAISDQIQRYRKIMKGLRGNEIKNTKLLGVDYDQSNDWVQFYFQSTATPDKLNPSKKMSITSQGGRLQTNPDKTYILTLRINKFFEWLFDSLPDGQELTLTDLKDSLKVCGIQIDSDCPSYWWQGFAWNVTQLDAAINPCTIQPNVWDKLHGDTFLDKHFAALFMNIDFLLNQMLAALVKRLRAAGIINKVS